MTIKRKDAGFRLCGNDDQRRWVPDRGFAASGMTSKGAVAVQPKD
jgi:hypothetical protein